VRNEPHRRGLADAMGVNRRTVNELCTKRRAITVDTALILARVCDNTVEFWLNLLQRNDLWQALNSPVASPGGVC
jgi:antitoxin HigA-1